MRCGCAVLFFAPRFCVEMLILKSSDIADISEDASADELLSTSTEDETWADDEVDAVDPETSATERDSLDREVDILVAPVEVFWARLIKKADKEPVYLGTEVCSRWLQTAGDDSLSNRPHVGSHT